MINEGIIVNDTRTLMKSEMLRALWAHPRTTPGEWEQHVFEALTGGKREDVDWKIEDNQAGYYTWVRSFDQLVQELIDDGYVLEEEVDGGKVLTASETDPSIDYSQAAYPSR